MAYRHEVIDERNANTQNKRRLQDQERSREVTDEGQGSAAATCRQGITGAEEGEMIEGEYTEIGGYICKWCPTPEIKFTGGILHQLWEASATLQDGGECTEQEWRKVASE